jgi:phospholipase D1/2
MRTQDRPERWRWLGVAWWVVVVAVAIAAKLGGWLDPRALIEQVSRAPAALVMLGVVATFVVAGLAFVPVTIMIATCGALFGPRLGLAYGLAGAFLAATTYYAIGRRAGQPVIDRFAGPRLRTHLHAVARRGVLAVVVLRLLPIAPHVVVGLAVGATRIRFRDYLLGTMLVITPLAIVLVTLGDALASRAAP